MEIKNLGLVVKGAKAAMPGVVPLTNEQQQIVQKLLVECTKNQTHDQEWELREAEETRQLIASKESCMQSLQTTDKWHAMSADSIDELMGRAIRANKNGELNGLLIEACEAFKRCPNKSYDYSNWSHAVCHNFEHFTAGVPESSILGFAAARQAAEGLIEEATARALQYGDGCFSRTMGGVLSYAFSLVEPGDLDKPFPWKPACISTAEVAAIFKPADSIAAFCLAKTPRDYIEKVAQLAVESSEEEYYEPVVNLELAQAARNASNSGAIDAFIFKRWRLSNSNYAIKEVENFLEHRRLALEARQVLPGLFVDVGGTLVAKNWETKALELTETAKLIITLAPGSRENITVFTGDDPQQASELLISLGFPTELLPVQSKSDFRGKRLACLIDDTSAEVQGFTANVHISPGWSFGRDLLKNDVLHLQERLKAAV